MYDDHEVVLDAGHARGCSLYDSAYGLSDDKHTAILHENLNLFDHWITNWHANANDRLQTFFGPATG